jgi:outer membrane protein TolC
VAQNNALDRLDLSVSLGKIGTDPTLDRAWADISNHQTYEWTVGLNYIHHFGSDINRLEYTRATIVLEQSRLQGDADERAWHIQDISLRLALRDAKATVEEQERVLDAYREEARLTHIQADNGLISVKDYLDIEQQVTDAAISVLQARLDVLRAELRLRAQEDRLLELLPK